MSSGLEKNLVFLHGFANIICIITRKFDFRGKFLRKLEKKNKKNVDLSQLGEMQRMPEKKNDGKIKASLSYKNYPGYDIVIINFEDK